MRSECDIEFQFWSHEGGSLSEGIRGGSERGCMRGAGGGGGTTIRSGAGGGAGMKFRGS